MCDGELLCVHEANGMTLSKKKRVKKIERRKRAEKQHFWTMMCADYELHKTHFFLREIGDWLPSSLPRKCSHTQSDIDSEKWIFKSREQLVKNELKQVSEKLRNCLHITDSAAGIVLTHSIVRNKRSFVELLQLHFPSRARASSILTNWKKNVWCLNLQCEALFS